MLPLSLERLHMEFFKGFEIPKSRHPHLLYWFWTPEILENKKYLRDLDLVAHDSSFTMVILSARDGMNFWRSEIKPYLNEAVRYAHELGLKIVIQLWPQGFFDVIPQELSIDEAFAMLNEGECVVQGGEAYYRDDSRHVCKAEIAPVEKSQLIKAFAFMKASDGVYFDGTLQDVTHRAEILSEKPGHLEMRFSLPEAEGATVYVMTAHYHRYGDLFSEYYIRDYDQIMEKYRDIPFDGVVLDEMKNLEFTMDPVMIRERCYGAHFKQYFENETGRDFEKTLFEMRYTGESDVNNRPVAINLYYDILRRCTRRIERFVAEKSQTLYGKDAFLGLHNTFHNHLQNDEIMSTGINWWEVPRAYAQTDEDIAYPVRMGIACQCKEALIYDMFYAKTIYPFQEKAMRDAKFGCRLHYHAMNDGYWGVDTGSAAFIETIDPIERKIDLLNLFEPTLPAMDLLVVFGFPALCNWYPDIRARNRFDINGSLNIMERVKDLWDEGYLNALAPSDALDDGRIMLSESGKFMYGGHAFSHLLFLYPAFSKKSTLNFLEDAVARKASIRIIGEVTADFDGDAVSSEKLDLFHRVTLPESADIPQAFDLCRNPLDGGCVLEDGSAVFSDLESLQTRSPKQFRVPLQGHVWTGTYEGVAALRVNKNGDLVRLVCGNCRLIQKDSEVLFEDDEGVDIAYL